MKYIYYSTQRPISLGTFPGNPVDIYNFDQRENHENLMAWGYLVYDRELTEKEISDYELVPSTNNPKIEQEKGEERPEDDYELEI